MSFEDRIIAAAGEENLKTAKQLLKSHALIGAWRDGSGLLRGRFRALDQDEIETAVSTGENAACDCSCGSGTFCAHGAALLLYGGRFRPVTELPPEEAPSYYGGLRRESFPELLRHARPHEAHVFIDAASNLPHVPSKWECVVLQVRLRTPEREYIGNVSNLRQLYFEKSLGVILHLEDFPLQEQQIIRFLAINGEPENSRVTLNSEQTAEFFHILIDYPRFFRDGRQLFIRRTPATPVMIASGKKLLPGIRVGEAVLPVDGAKVVTGRAGCWVGREGEYFFVPALWEIGFLRNFFRCKQESVPEGLTRDELSRRLPFPVVSAKGVDLDVRTPSVSLDGAFDEDGALKLQFFYAYEGRDGEIRLPHRTGTLHREGESFWKRDLSFERQFEQFLEMFGFQLAPGAATLKDPDSAGYFLDRAFPELLHRHPGWTLSGRLAALMQGGRGLPPVELSCRLLGTGEEAFAVEYRLSAAGHPIPWETAASSAKGHRNCTAIPGVGLAALSPAAGRFFRAAPGAIRALDATACTFEVPFFNGAYFTAITREVPGALVPEIAAGEAGRTLDLQPPKFRFKGELRNYQQEGVRFLQRMTDRGLNPLLADEMGLGKTVQTLALLASRLHEGCRPCLIVCPASLVTNWEREAERFVPGLRIAAPLTGAERNEVLKHPETFHLIILSYAAARLSSTQLKHLMAEYLILDEAQHIKNPGSGNAKTCKNISARHRIVLSGTPLENSPEDLWSVMDFLHPGMLGTLPAFRKTYAGAAISKELQLDLARRANPFFLRRSKAQVAEDLPPRTDLTIYCNMSEEQRKLYETVRAEGLETLAKFDPRDKGSGAMIFTTLLRLRQICCDPGLLPDGAGENVPSAKGELLKELLHEHIDSAHKMLLFSQFTTLLQRITAQLTAEGIPFEYLDGATRNRQARVDHFNQSPEIPLFLLSLKAGGTGLNLTSADTVIIYDPWWNPAVESQAAGRSHRIGQRRAVSTIRLVVKDSIEEKILALQSRKQELFNTVMDDPGAAASQLSLDELRALLG